MVRDGRSMTLDAVLTPIDTGGTARAASSTRLAGAKLRELSPRHSLYDKADGVEVAAVERGSRASRLGLQAGDVIVSVNRRAVTTVRELNSAISGDAPFSMVVYRGTQWLLVRVK